ncbi:NAD-glutamate dehydrogenase [Arenibaculum sp.]|uniref:NAD-glutamate dehydrogenase n=1 Tax=Arenibaculum sp. TaxID=2865862 RepID=UPI002E10E191|nr:NAD-glutamate dehydrogenase [Arenibaculum sp.]
MALKAEQLKGELTEKIVRQVRDRLNRDKADPAERFVRQFYANVPPDDIVQSSPDQLYGAALSIWQFGQQREPDRPRVRVYTPRVEEQGWAAGHTVVEIVNDDMPFLVDSVTAEVNRHNLTVHLVIHPVVRARRDARGALVELYEPQAAPAEARAESFMHVEVDEVSSPEVLEALRVDLERVLGDVRAAVGDWQAMRRRAEAVIEEVGGTGVPVPRDELDEGLDFLRWLNDDNFTFLGCRSYRFEDGSEDASLAVVPDSGLGILRDENYLVFQGLRNFQALPPEVRQFMRQPRLLLVTKSNRKSTVHRPTQMDAIFVKVFDENGEVAGEHLFVGLFTSVAYSRSTRDIPFLRKKVTRVLQRAGFEPRSHDGKALIHILEGFQRDELFQIGDDELYEIALGVLHLQERQRTALFVRRDPFERFVTCLVFVPRDRYDTDLRRRIQAILETAFRGTSTTFYTQLAESVLARVQFHVETTPGAIPDVDLAELEARLIEASRAWSDRLLDALVEARGEEQGLRLHRRYTGAFPTSYRENFGAEVAVFDIERIEQALHTRTLGLNLYRRIEAGDDELHLKLYHEGAAVPLSDALPMLERMGLKVLSEAGPFEIRIMGRQEPVWMHDFAMSTRSGATVDLREVKQAFQDAFARVWAGETENDGFNRLVLLAGLGWREVMVLRAYAKYLRQARLQFSQDYLEDALSAHPAITRQIVRLFRTLHDPARPGTAEDRRTAANGILVEIEHRLDAVANLDEDRILRRFLNLVRSTLRTNFFQTQPDGMPKPHLALKLDSRSIDDLPLPRPWVEMFVYSPRVEGVHLRGGKVARGGIRWSDRREDFRTEILGLMKAQTVKNAVIVPVGAKGGFVVKRPPAPSLGRDAWLAEGIECYRTFIRGLLDVTDTLGRDGEVIVPPDVVRLDGDDPYLVVAADKGTATFSDIANGIAIDYGFWLGDAFASGGSQGYDHKKMGITARGAWESVKRHFRELGTDIQTQDFTVVGVGDMSGDVFGNGMLLSRHIRLVGAFNHLHIFCDPDPDPERSWEERQRLFDLPRSTWADYDAQALSPGARIYERAAKSIELTPQIRARFGIARERVTPAELVQAMLKAETDLLWFGGIGTYVKCSDESHAEVGDKTNDGLRVDADELHARVVGEGANLAMTQRARIEAAGRGVKLNTDAIDNSAGVDTSDHEVNIKIVLGDVVGRGDMTLKQRDRLLVDMTDEVAALVLADNYLQTQALSLTEVAAPDLLENQARFMRALEKAGDLDRAIEALPGDEEIGTRMAARAGLTRPETAVLLAYGKIALYRDVLASNLPDDPGLTGDLLAYFPGPLREGFAEAVARHRLRREIVATAVTNSLVNRCGPTFVMETMEKTGMGPSDVARAYLAVREAFGLRRLWQEIQGLDNLVPTACQYEMLAETQRLIYRAVSWLLVNVEPQPLDLLATREAFGPGVTELSESIEAVLCEDDRQRLSDRAAPWIDAGAPAGLASRVAALPLMGAALEVTRIASQLGRSVPEVATVHYALGHRFGLEWLRSQAYTIRTDTHWQRQAVGAIVDDLFALQGSLSVKVLSSSAAAVPGEGDRLIDDWIAARPGPVERIVQLLGELRAQPVVDLAMLAVANRQLRGLVAG